MQKNMVLVSTVLPTVQKEYSKKMLTEKKNNLAIIALLLL